MSELARVTISLEEQLLGAFDRLIEVRGYANRSEAIRDLIRDRLVREQFVVRTPRGRIATPRAFQLLGRKAPPKPDIDLQPGLFE